TAAWTARARWCGRGTFSCGAPVGWRVRACLGSAHEMMFLLHPDDSCRARAVAKALRPSRIARARTAPESVQGRPRASEKKSGPEGPREERNIRLRRTGCGAARLPVELRARLDDAGPVADVLPLAVALDVVQRELEVAAPVPVHAGGPGVHPAALDRTVVEVDRVVAQTQLPHAAGGCVRERGGGHAALVAPGLAGE